MTTVSAKLRAPTRRNAELLMLIFAVLSSSRPRPRSKRRATARFSSRLITYAAVPIGIGVITHLVIRKVAPYADPLLLPIAVLLNGLGLVMIHRLDLGLEAAGRATTASASAPPRRRRCCGRRSAWRCSSCSSCSSAITACCSATRTRSRWSAWCSCCCRRVLPARFSEVNGARIWIRRGRLLDPARRVREDPADDLRRRLPRGQARRARACRPAARRASSASGSSASTCRAAATSARCWRPGWSASRVLVRGHDLGTSLLFFGLFVVLLYVTTERVSWVIIGILLFAAGAYVSYQLFGTVQTRVDVWLHLFDSCPTASPARPDGYQLRQSLFGLGTGGIFGTGLGSGHPELVPLPADRLHHLLVRRRDRPVRRRRAARAVRAVRRTRPRRRARGARRVRQAARDRPVVPGRPAAVRRRRRVSPGCCPRPA